MKGILKTNSHYLHGFWLVTGNRKTLLQALLWPGPRETGVQANFMSQDPDPADAERMLR